MTLPLVRHDSAGQRFLAEVDGHTAVLEYHQVDDSTVDFASTFVPDALRGRKVGTTLVLFALDWARGEGVKVRPSCWFVRTVAQNHAGYLDSLLA